MDKRPCPFCGSNDLEPSFHHHPHMGNLVCMSCAECSAEGPPVKLDAGREDAIAAAYLVWNQREAKSQ
jgi:Lar family restriction alleviation protein